jgi:glycosyltransferase involved in cell wall biosynthesis
MSAPLPKLCLVVTTPLIVHFFLKPHVVALSRHFEVTLVSNPANDSYLPPLDVPVRHVAVGIERKISLLHDLAALFGLYRLFRRERFDLVVSAAPKAGLLGMLGAFCAGVKRRVHIFQGEVWASRRGVMRAVLKTADRMTVACATHVLAVGPGEKRFLEEEGIVRPGVIDVLGAGSIGGVDMRRFRPDPALRQDFRTVNGIPEDATVCLFIGRLTTDKGVFDLARAFTTCGGENPRLWLVLAGPDEDGIAASLRSVLAGDVARRMLIHGFTPAPERYLAAADFLCLPSYREGFPMVILEAAASGLPSIGSQIYGVRDAIVDGETGLLVPPGDAAQLAAAMSRLACDEEMRRRLASAARARVEREFSQAKVVAGYVDYLRGLPDAR